MEANWFQNSQFPEALSTVKEVFSQPTNDSGLENCENSITTYAKKPKKLISKAKIVKSKRSKKLKHKTIKLGGRFDRIQHTPDTQNMSTRN